MLLLDIIIHITPRSNTVEDFGLFASLMIVFVRILEQNLVNAYVYYMIYWTYRFQYEQNAGYDVNFYTSM